jgi:hypothetical protein
LSCDGCFRDYGLIDFLQAEDELLRKKLQQQSLGLGGLGFDEYL